MPDEDQPTLFDLLADPTDAAVADLAAEGDAAVPSDAAGDDGYTDDEPAYTGVCRGGPYDARTVAIRCAGGFLLFDKQQKRLWTYAAYTNRPGEYVLLGDGGITPFDNIATIRAAADGALLDVLAYDDGPVVP